MLNFTGWEYLLIDAANHFGLNKINFDKRIEFIEENLDNLEELAGDRGHWKDKPLFLSAVHAIRDVQQGKPTGHLVGFDAVCSGMQIMSVVTGCKEGAYATGLIDPDNRKDAYQICSDLMGTMLNGQTSTYKKEDVKQACMTTLYGSKREPINLFGEDTEELNAFYQAMYKMAPGACHLLQMLINSWKPFALVHEWILPDGYVAKCKVFTKQSKSIEVDELNGSSFTYEFYENTGEEYAVKNAANVIHSIDAYIMRSLVRRCSYDKETFDRVNDLLYIESCLSNREVEKPNSTKLIEALELNL